MPKYKVKHNGQVQEVTYDGANPTKDELRAILQGSLKKPTFDYPSSSLPKPPSPSQYYQKDWLEKLDPHARDLERADRNMFTVDMSQPTSKAVDRAALTTDNEAERKWKAQKLGFFSGASESALNMLGAPENVLMGAPKLFRQRMADYPGHSINPKMNADLVPVGAEEAYNSSFPKPALARTGEEIAYENIMRNRGRADNPWNHVLADQTGAVGKNIRQGHISGRFLKKNTPYEPDSFDSGKLDAVEEPIDYVKQMLDSLKLADEQKKLAGLSPVKKTSRGSRLLTDETGMIGDIERAKAAKTGQPVVKKGDDFDYDGNWDVVMPSGNHHKIFKDSGTGMWMIDSPEQLKRVAHAGKPKTFANSKKEMIEQLKKLDGLSPEEW